MKNVLIIGSTGMVGSLTLKEALRSSEVGKVISISRRSLGIENEKFEEVLCEDFLDYSSIKDKFQGIDIAYFCLGVYTGAVPRDEFRKITVDYTKIFADTLKEHSPNANFVFLSGAGADRSEKSKMMFAKDKGIAENYLLKSGFTHLFIFRPAYIYPVTPRVEPNLTYKITRFIYPLLKLLAPKSVVTSEHLAHAMFKVGLDGFSKDTLENGDILGIELKS